MLAVGDEQPRWKPPTPAAFAEATPVPPGLSGTGRRDSAPAGPLKSPPPTPADASLGFRAPAKLAEEERPTAVTRTTNVRSSPPSTTVMVVGTGERMDAAIREALARRGMSVAACASIAVQRAVRAAAPDLVLLLGDAASDGGRRVLRLLANDPATAIIPVAVLGDETEGLDDRLSAFRHGAVAVVARTASADAIGQRIATLAHELPERSGSAEGDLGEATLDELTDVIRRELRSGILSVHGRSDDAVRIVLGAGRPVHAALKEFVERIKPLVARAEPLRYELLEEPESRIQAALPGDRPRRPDASLFDGLRILVIDNDPGRADALAQELRRLGGKVMVTGTQGDGLSQARELDPQVVILDAATLEGPDFEFVRAVRRDVRLRWASLVVASWDELWPNRSLPPDTEKLGALIEPMLEQDKQLYDLARARQAFDTRLEITGPSRLLKILADANHTLHATVTSPKAMIEVDFAEGLVVGALGTRPDGPPMEGAQAIAGLLTLSSGRVQIERRENPAVANIMSPAEVSIGAATAEPSPIKRSTPPAEDSVLARLGAPIAPTLFNSAEQATPPRAPSDPSGPLLPKSPGQMFAMPKADEADSRWSSDSRPPSRVPSIPPAIPLARIPTVPPPAETPSLPAARGPLASPSSPVPVADLIGLEDELLEAEEELTMARVDPEVRRLVRATEPGADLVEELGERAAQIDRLSGNPPDPMSSDIDEAISATAPTERPPPTYPNVEDDIQEREFDSGLLPTLPGPDDAVQPAPATPYDATELIERERVVLPGPAWGRYLRGATYLAAVLAVLGAVAIVAYRFSASPNAQAVIPVETDREQPAPRVQEDAPETGPVPERPTASEPERPMASERAESTPALSSDEPESPAEAATLIDPRRSPRSLIREGEALVRTGDVLAAGPLFERALELAPRDNHALIGMARVWLSRGEPDRAIDLAEQAVRMRARRAPYRLTLADALAAAGRADEARTQYRRVLRQDPGNRRALVALGNL